MPIIVPTPAPSSGAPKKTLEERIRDGAPKRKSIWRDLRALRHQPPGFAARGERKRVFCAALEQAEQLFEASNSVGYSTRPILLFYGMSQAGRAVAAASTHTKNNDWKLSGHGIGAIGLGQTPRLRDLEISNKGKGSFTQLASILQCGSIPASVKLGDVWSTIPELLELPLDGSSSTWRPVLSLDFQYPQNPSFCHGWIRNLPAAFGPTPREQDIVEFLKSYPSLAKHRPAQDGYVACYIDPTGGKVSVPRAWEWPRDKDVNKLYRSLTQAYRSEDDRWVFPALGGESRPLDPLLMWWAVLYALSMLARYDPANWRKWLEVNESPDAVPLETALDIALEICPHLIGQAIARVAQ